MKRAASLTLAAAGAAFTVAPLWAFAQQPESNRYDCGSAMMGWGGGWYAMIFGPLFMILGLAVAIAVAAVIVRGFGGAWQWTPPPPSHQMPPARTALDILKERYARGEIDKAEFEERRRVLGD
jgi:putative membrane protein